MSHHLKAEHIDDAMHECIENCSDCHDVCTETLVHCLGLGGEHAALEHVRALMDCAQACDTSRDFMLRGSELHHAYCGACAQAGMGLGTKVKLAALVGEMPHRETSQVKVGAPRELCESRDIHPWFN